MSGPPGITPAQFTSACTRPRCSIAARAMTFAASKSARSTAWVVTRSGASALVEEGLHDPAADALGGAGDDDTAVGEAPHLRHLRQVQRMTGHAEVGDRQRGPSHVGDHDPVEIGSDPSDIGGRIQR